MLLMFLISDHHRASCNKSIRPAANNLLDDKLETYSFFGEKSVSYFELTQIFYIWVKTTRFPACFDQNETLLSSCNNDALGRSKHVEGHRYKACDCLCWFYINTQQPIKSYRCTFDFSSVITKRCCRRHEFIIISSTIVSKYI
jgi:hypothetical protein